MQIERRPFVPFGVVGGLESFMSDKTFWAKQYGPRWDVLHWENGKIVCDTVVFDEHEQPKNLLQDTFG